MNDRCKYDQFIQFVKIKLPIPIDTKANLPSHGAVLIEFVLASSKIIVLALKNVTVFPFRLYPVAPINLTALSILFSVKIISLSYIVLSLSINTH